MKKYVTVDADFIDRVGTNVDDTGQVGTNLDTGHGSTLHTAESQLDTLEAAKVSDKATYYGSFDLSTNRWNGSGVVAAKKLAESILSALPGPTASSTIVARLRLLQSRARDLCGDA